MIFKILFDQKRQGCIGCELEGRCPVDMAVKSLGRNDSIATAKEKCTSTGLLDKTENIFSGDSSNMSELEHAVVTECPKELENPRRVLVFDADFSRKFGQMEILSL